LITFFGWLPALTICATFLAEEICRQEEVLTEPCRLLAQFQILPHCGHRL